MYLRECAPKSAKLTRWALGLQEFNIIWSYSPGSRNQGDLPWKTTSVMMNVFLRICFIDFMCYDIITSLDAVECDIVYHLFIIDIWTASEMTFITVHLLIPGLDILNAQILNGATYD